MKTRESRKVSKIVGHDEVSPGGHRQPNESLIVWIFASERRKIIDEDKLGILSKGVEKRIDLFKFQAQRSNASFKNLFVLGEERVAKHKSGVVSQMLSKILKEA